MRKRVGERLTVGMGYNAGERERVATDRVNRCTGLCVLIVGKLFSGRGEYFAKIF